LGIFYRIWCLLEGSCHELDLELATHTSPNPTDRESYRQYSLLVKELTHLSEKKLSLAQLVSSLSTVLGDLAIQFGSETHPLVQALKDEVQRQAQNLEKLVCRNNAVAIQ
jgi:hypothetical protein